MPQFFDFLRSKFQTQRSPLILMYHRVAELACDPWELAINLDHFDQQMEALRRIRKPLSMKKFIEGLRDGSLSERAVAVTFDDGYLDNLVNAKPILERRGIPATVFLATGAIGQCHEFWWDELTRLILQSEQEVDDVISIGDSSLTVQLSRRPEPLSQCEPWRATKPPRCDREELYLAIWRELRSLEPSDRTETMRQLRIVFSSMPPDPSNFPIGKDDFPALIDGDTFSVAAHTVNHPLLSSLHPEERQQEIQQSKADCERLTGFPCEGFAYPYGDYDLLSQRIVAGAGYQWACSTRSDRFNLRDFNLFELPRLQARGWSLSNFERLIS